MLTLHLNFIIQHKFFMKIIETLQTCLSDQDHKRMVSKQELSHKAKLVVFPPDIFRSDVLETASLTLTLVDTCDHSAPGHWPWDPGPPFPHHSSDHVSGVSSSLSTGASLFTV